MFYFAFKYLIGNSANIISTAINSHIYTIWSAKQLWDTIKCVIIRFVFLNRWECRKCIYYCIRVFTVVQQMGNARWLCKRWSGTELASFFHNMPPRDQFRKGFAKETKDQKPSSKPEHVFGFDETAQKLFLIRLQLILIPPHTKLFLIQEMHTTFTTFSLHA